jgi:hypothetical protein
MLRSEIQTHFGDKLINGQVCRFFIPWVFRPQEFKKALDIPDPPIIILDRDIGISVYKALDVPSELMTNQLLDIHLAVQERLL